MQVEWAESVPQEGLKYFYFLLLFLIKMQTFRPSALLKKDWNTGVFCKHWEIFRSTYSEVHLQTASSESFIWILRVLRASFLHGQITLEVKKTFSQKQNKTQNCLNTQLYEKNLPFHDVLYHFVLIFFSTPRQTAFALHSKEWF